MRDAVTLPTQTTASLAQVYTASIPLRMKAMIRLCALLAPAHGCLQARFPLSGWWLLLHASHVMQDHGYSSLPRLTGAARSIAFVSPLLTLSCSRRTGMGSRAEASSLSSAAVAAMVSAEGTGTTCA